MPPALFTYLYAGSALVIFGQQIGNEALLHLAETQATYLQDNPLTTRLLGARGWKCSPSSSASVWKLQKNKEERGSGDYRSRLGVTLCRRFPAESCFVIYTPPVLDNHRVLRRM